LQYILKAPYWKGALKLLSSLEALHCLHPNLHLDRQLWWQIRCIDRWLYWLDRENILEHWLIRLEVLIASLPEMEREKVANNLQLPKDSIERLKHLERVQTEIRESLPKSQHLSEVVMLLRRYNIASLFLVAVRSDKNIRLTLWQYLTRWSKIEAPINGNDLKLMGYKPGPKYKKILEDLLKATLDGEISDRACATEFVRRKYFE
jgi:tRNA nucleotidyltransferase (CCA-adding enzyme)